jgi:hypothetical protein
MKRLFIGAAFVMVIFLFGSVMGKQNLFTVKAQKKNCSGYVVIEFNKGIDCNGDTIKLMKKHGYYEMASN